MGGRLGVGAASASAVVFSILLFSGFVVFAASQGRQLLYSQADAEDQVADTSVALMGASATNILLEAQAALSSTVLWCSTAAPTVSALVGGLSDRQQSQGVTESASASLFEGGGSADNLSMVAPFDGSTPGEVDISVRAELSGSVSGAGVSFEKTEAHLVHLPAALEKLSDDCQTAVGDISQAVPGMAGHNCTVAAVTPLMEKASRAPASRAAADNFSFDLAFAVAVGPSCVVSFQVSLAQSGVPGPGGAFSLQVEEGGSASFEPPATRPPA